MITTGSVPTDGFLGSTVTSGYRFRPNFTDGKRLSGIITVAPMAGAPVSIIYRMLVDGVPQASNTIDTNNWPDGTHVIAFQIMSNPDNIVAHNGSRVVVFNNSVIACTSKTGQAIVGDTWGLGNSIRPNGLAWVRVDNVTDPIAYPLYPQLAEHPKAETDAQRTRLASETIWWAEGLTHQPTQLWQPLPILMKNKDGDYFIKHFNPQGGGSGVTPSAAQPYIERAPAYDGPRGIGFLGPYAGMTPYMHERLASGEYGWIAIEKSGRVCTVDITGEVRTILGPRSVAGVVGTDCDEMTVTLDMRIANGEKEMVGDINGQRLNLPHDMWPCSSFPFEGMVADTGNNCVTEINFSDKKLMRRWPLSGVTSVCDSYELQQQYNIIWVAANPEGLWCQRHTIGAPGVNPHPVSGGPTGTYTGHVPTLEKLVDIPKAFWCRVLGHKVYVFTTDLGIYEYDAATGVTVQKLARREKEESYVFANIDEYGSIGPVGRIYWGSASKRNGGYGSDKVSLFWFDPDTMFTGTLNYTRLINKQVYGSWTASADPLGHYMWGIAIHPYLPKFLSCGITSSSWFMWTGCLGQLPVNDAKIVFNGTDQFRKGVPDSYIGLSALFGYNGHGCIGYSCDMFRQYKTYAEAREAMMAVLTPLFHPDMCEADREAIAKQLFMQRTRLHYQDAAVIIPDPDPDPDPEVEPLVVSQGIVAGAITGGTKPYVVTVSDSSPSQQTTTFIIN